MSETKKSNIDLEDAAHEYGGEPDVDQLQEWENGGGGEAMISRQFLALEILCLILAACCILRGHIGWTVIMLGCAAVSNSMIGRDR